MRNAAPHKPVPFEEKIRKAAEDISDALRPVSLPGAQSQMVGGLPRAAPTAAPAIPQSVPPHPAAMPPQQPGALPGPM